MHPFSLTHTRTHTRKHTNLHHNTHPSGRRSRPYKNWGLPTLIVAKTVRTQTTLSRHVSHPRLQQALGLAMPSQRRADGPNKPRKAPASLLPLVLPSLLVLAAGCVLAAVVYRVSVAGHFVRPASRRHAPTPPCEGRHTAAAAVARDGHPNAGPPSRPLASDGPSRAWAFIRCFFFTVSLLCVRFGVLQPDLTCFCGIHCCKYPLQSLLGALRGRGMPPLPAGAA